MQPEDNPLVEIANAVAGKLLYNLQTKSIKVQDKYDYYNADNDIRDFGISTPKRMRHSRPGIGWASRAVNVLSDRVVFDGFGNDTYGVNDMLDAINGGVVIDKAKHDAFVAGVAFVAVSEDDDGRKVLVPFDAGEATGIVDQTTGLLKVGLAVTRWGEPKPKSAISGLIARDYIVFTPEWTAIYEGRTISEVIPNNTGRTLLHPLTHRASANRPMGKSRITNTARRIIDEVGRLKRREEIAEEFYALPQRYITGLAEGAEKDNGLDSAIGLVWAITKDDEGEKPDVGQLTQMSIDGFIGAKKDKARDFCAETALTLRNLGYETGNPTSAESLSAMSDDLLLEATNSQVEMGKQIKEIAITLRLAMDDNDTIPAQLSAIQPAWKPIFQIDIGATGDAMFKLYQAMPELIGTVAGYRMLGVSIREAEDLMKRRAAAGTNAFMTQGNTGAA